MSEEELKKETQIQNVELYLQLGDVIQITNPNNEILNNQIFIIDYIDKSTAYLIDTDSLNRVKLKISEDGILGDGNITQISILSRADTPSYARQNGLLTGKWVNIYFGGDFPVIITGEITNLEKDMIEIETVDKDVIYINFDYKGIPENLPIDNIEIREKPSTPLKRPIDEEDEEYKEDEEDDEKEDDKEDKDKDKEDDKDKDKEDEEYKEGIPDLDEEKRIVPIDQVQQAMSSKVIKDQLREIIINADQIKFGDEELGPQRQYIDISGKSQRYSIEEQVTDLLDDLLSTIPNTQRTPRVLNNLHMMIDRFKQLRENFSLFDQYGNVESSIVKEASYKPLHNWLNKFNKNLYWILPVVKNIKKTYNVGIIDDENNDIMDVDLNDDIKNINEIVKNYTSSNLPVDSNKYSTLYSELNNYFTPFNQANDENLDDIIIQKNVQENLNVLIDNLGDMYSSVYSNNMVRNRRLAITRYNLGDTKLVATDISSSKMTTIRVPMTDNDIMSIKSIITLPESALKFSKINLPGSNILSKANLNEIFLNYWQLLRKKTTINTTFIDSLDMKLEFHENIFVSSIRNYTLNISKEELSGKSKDDIYKQFVNMIVPKTRVIFNLMKKYINGKLSIIEVVSYLEPFLIYTDDLTYKQYEEITFFIDKKISEYNKNMIELSKMFKIISTIKPVQPLQSRAFSVIDIINMESRDEIFNNGYNIKHNTNKLSNSELLRNITIKDYGRLYTSKIGYDNLKLMFPHEITDIFDIEKKNYDEKIKNEKTTDKCETIVIAKLYTSQDQLQKDNDKDIYFDITYDKTNYGVMEEDSKQGGYSSQVINLTLENLTEYIINDQIKRKNLTEPEAIYLADTLVNGIKKVMNGQYAILYKGDPTSNNSVQESEYYVRKNDKWVLDMELIKNNFITDEPSIMCDLQEKCINIPKKTGDQCESMKLNELQLQQSLLKNIMDEFDTTYNVSKEEFEKNIKMQYEYFMSIVPIISKIQTNAMLKYNNQQYKLGLNIDDTNNVIIVSPFSQLLDIILGQKDFTKKQNDIIKFCAKFTRTFIPGFALDEKKETEHWLYCIKTGACLIPSFKKELANSFITSIYTYNRTLEELKATIGENSDGDGWTDKFTGWSLCPSEFDTDEGYDDGFAASSRAVMEEDAGSKIISATTKKTIKYITPESIMINNIVNTLSIAMGINIETQKEFIINCVVETIRSTVESESDYKENIKIASQKGKNLPSYRDFFNTSLLYYTLGMVLIAVQTSIPSIKTRKTHPGCVRSFTGYPFDGQGDLSSLTYLACVTYDIRSSGEPWNVLKKTNTEKIQNKIQTVIDARLIQLPDVIRSFSEKIEYLLTSPATEIPAEHDISKWSDFLPPLVQFKIRHLANVSKTFKDTLENELRNGLQHQREKILVIESKIVQFSLAIQEKIQIIVKKHKVLLNSANNEPYLENACCDSVENEPTIDYFTSRDKDIIEFNNIVTNLNNYLDDIKAHTEALLFYSNINTKNIYPLISNAFNEKTIYLAFIFYCKFKSLRPIPENLLTICKDKPDATIIIPTDSIDRVIQKLKENGRNYNNEQFLRLSQIVSRENIVHMDLDNPIISSVTKLSKFLEAMDDEDEENVIIEKALRDLITESIDTFDIASEKTTNEVKDLNNYLSRTNSDMTRDLIEFVEKNRNNNVTKKTMRNCVETINNISNWKCDVSNRNENNKITSDTTYNIIKFYKTFIDNFARIFPNIILSKVNYDNTIIPTYYGFSKNHTNKLKSNISNYFSKLKPFYGIPSLFNILPAVQQSGKNTIKFSEYTPCFSSIKIGDKIIHGVIDERTGRYLFEFYLLRTLINYLELADNESIIVTQVQKTADATDVFSVEYIEAIETRTEFATIAQKQQEHKIVMGNKRELKEKTAELLVAFIEIFRNEKETVDVTYEDIQDRIFKLKEREKDMVTDRLKALTDEARDVDTILKITKQGDYSKGLQKGLTVYKKNFYEEEQNLRDEMESAERKIRKTRMKNKEVEISDDNLELMVDEFLEREHTSSAIEDEELDMSHLDENYTDGYSDGVDGSDEE